MTQLKVINTSEKLKKKNTRALFNDNHINFSECYTIGLLNYFGDLKYLNKYILFLTHLFNVFMQFTSMIIEIKEFRYKILYSCSTYMR